MYQFKLISDICFTCFTKLLYDALSCYHLVLSRSFFVQAKKVNVDAGFLLLALSEQTTPRLHFKTIQNLEASMIYLQTFILVLPRLQFQLETC